MLSTYLLVRRKDGKAGASGLVLLGGSQSPKCNGATAKLSEPALELGLGGIVRQAGHVKNLASLREESTNIGSGVHGTSQDIGMLLGRLRLSDQAAEHAGEGNSLLHGTARRGRGQCLQVKGKIVLDGGAGLDGLDLESGADVGEHGRTKRQRLGMVLLPALVFRSQVKGSGVLEIGGENDGLVTSLTGKLNSKIPGIESDKGKFEVLGGQVFGSKSIESRDGVSKGSRVSNMLPGESGQAGCKRTWLIYEVTQCDAFEAVRVRGTEGIVIGGKRCLAGIGYVLQRGVIGVLTGLTRTLSCVIWNWTKRLGQGQVGYTGEISILDTHLLECVGIKQNPAKLNNLSRILCDIDTMLITGGGNVDDDVSIRAELGALLGRHFFPVRGRVGTPEQKVEMG